MLCVAGHGDSLGWLQYQKESRMTNNINYLYIVSIRLIKGCALTDNLHLEGLILFLPVPSIALYCVCGCRYKGVNLNFVYHTLLKVDVVSKLVLLSNIPFKAIVNQIKSN